MEAFKITNYSFRYPKRLKPALKGLDFSVARGEFLAVCGQSGSGKSTLLRCLKPTLTPHGEVSGDIEFSGRLVENLGAKEEAAGIGFVLQNPDAQIVTDKVWHELAFGLESLGYDNREIRLRVSEMASFFGIQTWYYKDVNELSGGQKQLLNLAAVMVMQPEVLILDEPTSQLDPIAAREFLDVVRKINTELGTTIIISEHRLEDVIPMADRMLVLHGGELAAHGTPDEVVEKLAQEKHVMYEAMPAPQRAFYLVQELAAKSNRAPVTGVSTSASTSASHKDSEYCKHCEPSENPTMVSEGQNDMPREPYEYSGIPSRVACPQDVRTGREWLADVMSGAPCPVTRIADCDVKTGTEAAVTIKDVWFKYSREGEWVVKGLNLQVHKGELYCIVGGNGTGKTTSANLITGIRKPQRGRITINGAVSMLPQNPQTVFVREKVRDDLEEMAEHIGIRGRDAINKAIAEVANTVDITDLLDSHPYDLSGGEQQRAALAKVLLSSPDILILDEPTKGLDNEFKLRLGQVFKRLQDKGTTIIMVSHDIEFCANFGDRCGMFFDGGVITENSPREFFSGNSFYTTQANRMSRNILENAITVQDVARLVVESYGFCADNDEDSGPEKRGTQEDERGSDEGPENRGTREDEQDFDEEPENRRTREDERGSDEELENRGTRADERGFDEEPEDGGLGGIYWRPASTFESQSGLEVDSHAISQSNSQFGSHTSSQNTTQSGLHNSSRASGRIRPRDILLDLSMILLSALTIYIGMFKLEEKHTMAVCLLMVIYAMIPAFSKFEQRKPRAREIVIIAVLVATAVAGRAAFFMIPNFKPILAIIIISGIALGREDGFVVGAMSAFVSNFIFGHGPWTPWQMIAMAIIGYLAGLIFHRYVNSIAGESKVALAIVVIFGTVTVFFLYGGIVDLWTIFVMTPTPNLATAISVYTAAFYFNLVHAGSTALFLMLLAGPMIRKINRVSIKYGL